MAKRFKAPCARRRPRILESRGAAQAQSLLAERLRIASTSACRLATETDLQAMLDAVALDTLALLDAKLSVIRLLEPDGGLRRAASAGVPPEAMLAPVIFPSNEGVAGAALGQRRIVRYDAYDRVPSGLPGAVRCAEWGPAIGTPLLVGDRPLGTLVIIRPLGAEPFGDSDEAVLRLFAAHIAVAVEKARTLAELATSEARYRTLAEEARDLVYSTSSDGRILYINGRVEEMLGYTAAEVIGRRWRFWVAPESLRLLEARQQQRAAGLQPPPLFELELLHRNGTPVPVEIQATFLQAEGRLVGRVGIARDLRPRRRAEAERLAAERHAALLEGAVQTARATAHALNDSLARLVGEADLLMVFLPPDHALHERLRVMASTAEEIATAVQQFQRVARFESTRVAPDLPPMLDLPRAIAPAN